MLCLYFAKNEEYLKKKKDCTVPLRFIFRQLTISCGTTYKWRVHKEKLENYLVSIKMFSLSKLPGNIYRYIYNISVGILQGEILPPCAWMILKDILWKALHATCISVEFLNVCRNKTHTLAFPCEFSSFPDEAQVVFFYINIWF